MADWNATKERVEGLGEWSQSLVASIVDLALEDLRGTHRLLQDAAIRRRETQTASSRLRAKLDADPDLERDLQAIIDAGRFPHKLSQLEPAALCQDSLHDPSF